MDYCHVPSALARFYLDLKCKIIPISFDCEIFNCEDLISLPRYAVQWSGVNPYVFVVDALLPCDNNNATILTLPKKKIHFDLFDCKIILITASKCRTNVVLSGPSLTGPSSGSRSFQNLNIIQLTHIAKSDTIFLHCHFDSISLP